MINQTQRCFKLKQFQKHFFYRPIKSISVDFFFILSSKFYQVFINPFAGLQRRLFFYLFLLASSSNFNETVSHLPPSRIGICFLLNSGRILLTLFIRSIWNRNRSRAIAELVFIDAWLTLRLHFPRHFFFKSKLKANSAPASNENDLVRPFLSCLTSIRPISDPFSTNFSLNFSAVSGPLLNETGERVAVTE